MLSLCLSFWSFFFLFARRPQWSTLTYTLFPSTTLFLSKGGPQTPEEKAEVYFRTTPMFETGDDRYLWLNDIVAVGLGASIGGAVRYDVFDRKSTRLNSSH